MKLYKRKNKGFTLIELLVVVAIIGLLSSVVLASLNSARGKARDAKRKQDMVQIRTALELYYHDYGSYPLAYGGGWAGYSVNNCNGTQGTLSGATGYIINLAPTYIPNLPIDPSGSSIGCSGYLYSSNGTHYKLLSHSNNGGGPESYPSAGQSFYDPVRPTWALMLCSGEPACSNNGANNAW